MGGINPLLAWLDHEVPADPRQRTFVLCNSAMGAAAMRRALAEKRGAVLGVDFVTAAGLGRKLLQMSGWPCSENVPDPLEEREALRACLGDDEASRYAKRFDTALVQLHDTVRETQTLGPVSSTGQPTKSAQMILDTRQALEQKLAGEGGQRGGRSRWIATATIAAADGNLQLPSTILVAGYPAPERDVQLLLQVLRDRSVNIREFQHPDQRPALVRFLSCSDPVAELRRAARECLEAGQRGVSWHEMVVAAPRLRDYASDLHRTFEREGVPFQTAVEVALIRQPRAALSVHICRLLFDQAPRASFLAVATSHQLRRPLPTGEQAILEKLSRYESLRGTGESTVAFGERLDESSRDEAPNAALLLKAILHFAERGAGADDNHARAEVLREFFTTYVAAPDPEADALDATVHERLDDCLRAIVFADACCDSGQRFTTEFQDLLQRRTVPLPGQTRGGVPVVTYREALGFPCEYLHLLGMGNHAVPGPPPLRTFLDDEDRTSLGMTTTEIAREEEEQLLATLLTHATDLTVSFPRRNGDGMPQEFTLWSDRIRGWVDLPELEREPGHPQTRADRAVATGFCAPDLVRDHLALGGCRDAGLLREVADIDTARVLHRTVSLESFDADRLQRDGDIGSAFGTRLLEETISVTDFSLLGQCPQQFLFKRGMHVRPLPEEPDPLGLPRDRMGTLIHKVVEDLYKEFMEALQVSDDPLDLSEKMQTRATAMLRKGLAFHTSLLQRDFPGLHELIIDRWIAGVHHAIRDDLALMKKDGARPIAVERGLEGPIEVRRPQDVKPTLLKLRAQIDRIDRFEDDRVRVLDFKTGASPQISINGTNIFKGTNLQLVLYAMLLRAADHSSPKQLEIRSLRPGSLGTDDAPPPESRLPLIKGSHYVHGEEATGVQETLAILGRLLGRGLFPPSINQLCSWCRFKPACRRYHPPSAERTARTTDAELAQFTALRSKSRHRQVLYDGGLER